MRINSIGIAINNNVNSDPLDDQKSEESQKRRKLKNMEHNIISISSIHNYLESQHSTLERPTSNEEIQGI
jgi:hypothetical protein